MVVQKPDKNVITQPLHCAKLDCFMKTKLSNMVQPSAKVWILDVCISDIWDLAFKGVHNPDQSGLQASNVLDLHRDGIYLDKNITSALCTGNIVSS